MTDYKIHTYNKAIDGTLYNLAVKELGNGARWTEFLLETSRNSEVWKPATEPYLDGVRVKIPTAAPPAGSPGFDGELTVIASDGVNIRDNHAMSGKVLASDAHTKGATYKYKKNFLTTRDASGRVWVEVLLNEKTYSTGWLPVSGPSVLTNPNSPTEQWAKFNDPAPISDNHTPAVITTKFCTNCGTKLAVDAIYCSNCGKKQ